ncbi:MULTISPECIES: hypothetical protein [unclassified Pseudomonas]|uniref:hypothetical protein n=1 Tax=unclassified Pseudomonas TaxID=196821 RepID=UPI000C87A0E1|nr:MULTISPECIES: hypothetical protein [unclassified Pseudomonas]PMU09921.1 hypothetical protein C1Y11_14560 [Pseudomonas sp. FW305-20]PMU17092.1 hypothetical protein C1Y10_17260 [Pseudomonas sp. FW305-122]PMU37636.1 hypothetical protein C1Y12_18895 [Pseudomonas sp. FW305-47B]PMX61709.1 hypothetical protein C1Y13_11710 [Pseudomonas sp. FW305-33]PMX70578.1 hypothetical protein C1X12_04770 [Pseudomonas sp. FW305-60]
MLKVLKRVFNVLYPDRRPEREKAREREFILAVNKLKTLSVTDRGGMAINPEEIREQVITSREQLKHLVHMPGAPRRPLKVVTDIQVDQGASSIVGASVDGLDCIEVVAWRRLPSGAAVRYVSLQSTRTGRYAVATASLFSGGTESLPSWVDANTNRQVASAVQSELQWFTTVSEAMDAWDAAL